MNPDLSPLLRDCGLLYAILLRKDADVILEFGERSCLEHDGIFSAYLFSFSQMAEFLEGKPLPQMISQGRVFCVVSMPNPHCVVAGFALRDDDVFTRFRWAIEVDRAVRKLVESQAG